MVLQAYIDDSRTENGTFVLAGWIASVGAWAGFSREWRELLPFATIDRSGKRRFKMSEMAAQGRMRDVPAFYRVIEDHALFSLACKIDEGALRRAIQRVWVPDLHIEWGFFESPYLTCFRLLLHNFHNSRVTGPERQQELLAGILPLGQPIDFYFDDQSDKRAILSVWREFVETRPEQVRDLYGATPRFENDEEFLPLQAADFWAWWVREAYESGKVEELRQFDFGPWQRRRVVPGIIISFDEEQIVAEIMSTIRAARIGYGRPIYDAKYHPKPVVPGPSESSKSSLLARVWKWLVRS